MRGRVGLRAAGRRVPTSVVWSVLNAATYSSCVHGTALPTSARRAVPRCVYRRTHRVRVSPGVSADGAVCAWVARTKCFGGAARRGRARPRDHCARYLRGIGPRISRGWSSLWRFDIGSSGDSISSQTSVFRHDDIAQTVNSNMNLTPVARPMSYVNHAEAGERATIHTNNDDSSRPCPSRRRD